jgi:hypothetical protein
VRRASPLVEGSRKREKRRGDCEGGEEIVREERMKKRRKAAKCSAGKALVEIPLSFPLERK